MTSYFDDIKPVQEAIKKLPRDMQIFMLKWLFSELVERVKTET
jgi:hypothetical protein